MYKIVDRSLYLSIVRISGFIEVKNVYLPVTRCLAPLRRALRLGSRPSVIATNKDKIRTTKQNGRFVISNAPISSGDALMYGKLKTKTKTKQLN